MFQRVQNPPPFLFLVFSLMSPARGDYPIRNSVLKGLVRKGQLLRGQPGSERFQCLKSAGFQVCGPGLGANSGWASGARLAGVSQLQPQPPPCVVETVL